MMVIFIKRVTLNRIAVYSIMLPALFISFCMAPEHRKTTETATVNYYAGAAGIFALEPPPAVTDRFLPLRGSCRLPGLAFEVHKKNQKQTHQAVIKTNGNPRFRISFIVKDGAGDYEMIVYGKMHAGARRLTGLCSFSFRSVAAGDDQSELYINDKIARYVNGVIGTKVGSGECWDLAQEALDASGADWRRPYVFGLLLDPARDTITSGDIIQFKSVRLVTVMPNGATLTQTIGAPDHTAVITRVAGKNIYELAQQNSCGKRYVTISIVDLNNLKSGRYWIYRPVAGIIW